MFDPHPVRSTALAGRSRQRAPAAGPGGAAADHLRGRRAARPTHHARWVDAAAPALTIVGGCIIARSGYSRQDRCGPAGSGNPARRGDVLPGRIPVRRRPGTGSRDNDRMTRTQFYTATSIDGYIADQRHSLDWLFEAAGSGGGTGPEGFAGFFAAVGAFCMGASTFDWMGAHPEIVRWEETYGQVPCWVFTHRTPPAVSDLPVRFACGEVAPVHDVMVAAAGGKNIWLVGGGDMAGQLADAGLLDELIMDVAPVTLGGGAPLLPRRIDASRLRLAGVARHGGFARLTYALAPGPAGTSRPG